MPFSFDVFPTINDTDLIYGLWKERYKYWNTGPFRSLKGQNTIDSYHITDNEIASVSDPEKISYKNDEFIQYISNHEKYSSIQSVRSVNGYIGWVYAEPEIVLGRKCKAGLGWASENDIHVNFVLDKIDMNEVVDKTSESSMAKSFTSRELRYLYRNRNNEKIRNNVQFWNEGKPVKPPWETDPETWSKYKPKSEMASAQATTKAALEIQPTATNPAAAATATTEEVTTMEELGLEILG